MHLRLRKRIVEQSLPLESLVSILLERWKPPFISTEDHVVITGNFLNRSLWDLAGQISVRAQLRESL